ncbi:tetratricopeptide repeat protein 14 [Spatholobus suberectus]|nr:tetratricopeptide repeat protein 14 [Spatholobus suberectus]
MMKSPSQPTYEASHYDDYGFDLQQDFCQFLEEAKQHGKEAKLKSSSVHPEESGKTGSEKEKEKKGKKSWKSSLTSWWKADKKSKHRENPTNNSKPKGSGKRHGHSSGPMYSSCKGSDGKHWRPSSGPLISLFKSTKREENEIPYISLHQQNSPRAEQNYGPLYVVT